jgi:hypothetical protein
MHVYEVRPRKAHRRIDLISDALPFGGLWYVEAKDCEDQELDGHFNPAGVMK